MVNNAGQAFWRMVINRDLFYNGGYLLWIVLSIKYMSVINSTFLINNGYSCNPMVAKINLALLELWSIYFHIHNDGSYPLQFGWLPRTCNLKRSGIWITLIRGEFTTNDLKITANNFTTIIYFKFGVTIWNYTNIDDRSLAWLIKQPDIMIDHQLFVVEHQCVINLDEATSSWYAFAADNSSL